MKLRSRAKSWLSLLVAVSFAVPALLSIFGLISLRAVLSDSMAPKINVGDLVVSVNWLSPEVGDVAIYHERDINGDIRQDVVHRIITMTSDGQYQFKGDNNKSMDALSVPKSDIVGKIFLKIPAVGSLFNPVGIFFVMIFIGGLYVLVLGLNGLRKK